MSGLKKIGNFTLQEQVYFSLKEAIFDGHFLPGESVTIRFLAEELGTSVMPVRYAIQRLVTEMAMEAMPNRTVRFPLLSWAEFEDLMEVRALLDAHALTKVFSAFTEDMLSKLAALDQEFDDAVAQKEGRRACEANRRFHFTIYSLAETDTVANLVERVWLKTSPTVMQGYQLLFDINQQEAIQGPGHAELVGAVRAKDLRAAKKIIREDALRILVWMKQFKEAVFRNGA